MSKIEYPFYAFPKELWKEFKDDPEMITIIFHILERTAYEKTQTTVNGQIISLERGQFVYGRQLYMDELELSERKVRSRIETLENKGYIAKMSSKMSSILSSISRAKMSSTFTVYRLVKEAFSKNNVQQFSDKNVQQNVQQNVQPAIVLDLKNPRIIESHQSPSVPSSEKDQRLTDDLFSDLEKVGSDQDEKKSKITPLKSKPKPVEITVAIAEKQISLENSTRQHNINYHEPLFDKLNKTKTLESDVLIQIILQVKGKDKIITLSDEDYQECISIKGSHDSLVHAMGYIYNSPNRKAAEIYNWPKTLRAWTIKNDLKPRLDQNEKMGIDLSKEFKCKIGGGFSWSCEVHHNRLKDVKGVLFCNNSPVSHKEVFIPFIDPDFNEKCDAVIRENRLRKAPP